VLEKNHHFFEGIWQSDSSSIKQIAFGIVVGTFCYALSYASSIIVARVLGPKIFGDYASGISALWMIAGFSLIGADLGLGRFIPTYLKKKDYPGLNGYLRYYIKKIFLLQSAIFVFGIMTAAILYVLKGEHVLSIKETHSFYFFIWAIPSLASFSWLSKYIKASGYGDAFLLISTALTPLLGLTVLGVFLFFIRVFTISEALVIYFLAIFLSTLISVVFAYLKTDVTTIKVQAPRYELAIWKPITYQLFLLSGSISNRRSILLLTMALFDKDKKVVGFAAAVFAISNLMWVISNSICAISGPKVSVAVTSKNKKQITSLLLSGMLFSGLTNGAILLAILIWGDKWLQHFGSEFVEAYQMLIIVSVSIFVMTMISPLSWIFQQSDDLKKYTSFSLVTLFFYVIFCCLCAHLFGGIVAVIVYALMQLSEVVYLLILAFRNWNNPKLMN
jgi:O-antigen/teichoic acid export membrane protein